MCSADTDRMSIDGKLEKMLMSEKGEAGSCGCLFGVVDICLLLFSF